MRPRLVGFTAALLLLIAGALSDALAQSVAPRPAPPASIPTVSLASVARQGFFYAGGQYVTPPGGEPTMAGAMYVEVMVPRQIRSPYPVVFVHGAAQTAVDWLQTPDGRPGWAYNFLEMGFVVYLEDMPARGRSQYVPGFDGTPGNLNLTILPASTLEERFTAGGTRGAFLAAQKHTQWPGSGRAGDKVFDDFARTQVQFLSGNRQETLTRDANVALLDMIGTPVILVTHSQSGAFGWAIADARPNQVKAVVAVEPSGPPIRDVDTVKLTYADPASTGALSGTGTRSWGVSNTTLTYEPRAAAAGDLQIELETTRPESGKVPCYVQKEPAKVLKNLQNIPVLMITGEASYHDVYDHCTARWLNQARVKTEHVELEKVGMTGNGHMMMLEKNSADIAKFIGNWLTRNVKAGGDSTSRAMPPKTIPTFETSNLARKGFVFAGGSYWGEGANQIMRGAMYTEVWVPRQIRQTYPIVFYHGNGQTGVDWQQTPDGRRGWAYHLIDQGFVVYMVDYPARGRSAYVPVNGPDGKTPIDGNLSIRSELELERIWTNARERGDFPLKMNHTQWPGSGKMGDPIFDNFTRTQVQSAAASPAMAREAGIALLDLIGSPVVLFTHSQGGGIGFEVTEARPQLVKAMVTVEPGGPQFGNVDTAKVTSGPRNPNSWGLTNSRYEFAPPATQPADLKVVLEDKSDHPDEARCWMQAEPARKLARWQNIRVLALSANATYHRVYDPCIPKFLNQAGVRSDFIRLETVGITGNSHMMMLEKNSDDIIRFIVGWIQKNVGTT